MRIVGFDGLRRRWHSVKDGWFTRPLPDKLTIGTSDRWTVCTRTLDPRVGPVLSAGVGTGMTFELALAREHGMTVRLFDPSPIGCTTAARPENQDPRILFSPLGWAGASGDLPFADPEDPADGSFTLPCRLRAGAPGVAFPCRRVSELLAETGSGACPLLKMDIEGFEYGVLDDILDARLDIRQICLEFHHFLKGVSLLRTYRALWRLRRSGYVPFHKTFCDYSFLHRSAFATA